MLIFSNCVGPELIAGCHYRRRACGDVDGVRKNPQSPAVPSRKPRLTQINFRAVTPGTGQGFVQAPRFFINDLVTIAVDLDTGQTGARRYDHAEVCVWGPGRKIARSSGDDAAGNLVHKTTCGINGIQRTKRMTALKSVEDNRGTCHA